ncbi:hypothetical protein H9L12_07015 [Sphingomonas rhizophila]|uniref:PilZ domain-containing protein n=1 Tax=Sphingomonas rhizophila TaxID=2071607 RepID=A0A7G9S8G3_9SPHN|nr:hypothetical protein [Sphingomonas rhizophila]QNN64138.1 hypothetical protein H9L12_07015 [Sphingomonas rhizophila]
MNENKRSGGLGSRLERLTMKAREERRKVLIRARMRAPDGWHDACILNVSSRGLMVQAAQPAERGTYLEIRRGAHVIVGRVVWSGKHRLGLPAQDRLPVEALISDPDAAVATPAGRSADGERRRSPRPAGRAHEGNRQWAGVMEFASIALAGAFAASLAYAAIGEALARPIATISDAISPK